MEIQGFILLEISLDITFSTTRAITAKPKMAILIPVVKQTVRYFLFVQVPFAEDLREYHFLCLWSAGSQPPRKESEFTTCADGRDARSDR